MLDVILRKTLKAAVSLLMEYFHLVVVLNQITSHTAAPGYSLQFPPLNLSVHGSINSSLPLTAACDLGNSSNSGP